MSQTARAWLSLLFAHLRVTELGGLLARFGNVTDIVAAPAQSLSAAGLGADMVNAIKSPDAPRLDAAEAWLDEASHHLIAYGDEDYPELLAQIPGPPLALFVNGDIGALQLPSLAIVGSRNPTRGGIRNAAEFSRHLAEQGLVIVSGLAEGIDAAAHRGALEAGGKTIAFLGHGIDRVYPAANRDLAHQVAAGGALLSEYPLGTPPLRHHFPERNRLISGLSLGTLVIEAARRSGSLITARLAAEQGREVFALPGSIHNPLARGCHRLIRDGAKLVETAEDILGELGPLGQHMLESTEPTVALDQPRPDTDDDYVQLRELLSHDPISIDEMATQTSLTIDQLSSMLLILELHGEVESLSGGRYALSG